MATPTMPSMPSAATQESEQVQALRRLGAQRGYSPDEVQSRLEQAGLVQAPGSGFGHAAGVAARGLVQGAGNLIGLPFGMAGQAYQVATGKQPPAMLQPQGANVANQMGLPQPAGPGERVAMAAGENGMMAAALPGAGAGGIALGAGAGAAGQTAAEAGAGPMGQMAASAAVGMGIPIVGTIGAAAIRSAIAGASSARQAAEQSAALLRAGNPNAAVSLGQIAEGGIARVAQGGLRNIPGAGQVLAKNAETQAQQMGQRAEWIANRLAPGSDPSMAGLALQQGLKQGEIPRIRALSNDLYEQAFTYVPPDTPLVPSAAIKLHSDMNELFNAAGPLRKVLENPKVAGYMSGLADALEASPQGIPFNVVKETRSHLGAILDGTEEVTDINLRDVKRLYGALSEDMQDVIKTKGPEAMAAWQKAEAFWKQSSERISNILQPLIDKHTPEQAYNALLSGSRNGATILNGAMQGLEPEQQALVQSSVIRRLGMANPNGQNVAGDVFSPKTFLTHWNNFTPESRDALFQGADPKIVKDLNTLAKAVEVNVKAAGVMPNHPGTATNTAFFAMLAGLSTSVGGALAGSPQMAAGGLAPAAAIGGANIAARLFTNPKFVNWMVKQTQVPFGAMTQQVALLAKQSQSWSDTDRQLVNDFVTHLGGINWNQILTAQAVADGLAH